MAARTDWADPDNPRVLPIIARSNQFVVESLDIEAVRPDPRPQRRHTDEKLNALKAPIARFGQFPILVDETNTVLDGQAVLEACKRLGRKTIDVIRVTGLSATERRALMLALNKFSERATWNLDTLKADFTAFMADPSLDFAADLTGFGQVEIDAILMGDAETEQDDVPEPPTAPVSRHGDLWCCGRHRILCGDSTKALSYERLMRGEFARMVFSDVPYNVRIPRNVSGLGKAQHGDFAMASGEMTRPEFVAFLRTVFAHAAGVSLDGGLQFYFIDWRHLRDQIEAGEAVFGELKQMIVWVKDNSGMGSFYRSQHECITVWKAGSAPHVNNFGLGETGRHRTNTWRYPGYASLGKGRDQALAWHPTVKPLPMIIDGILDVTLHDDIVLDPFGGSGTTLIACERTGRVGRLIEIDPKYVDVTLARYQADTGQEAVLDETGETFSAVAARRAGEAAADDLDWDIA